MNFWFSFSHLIHSDLYLFQLIKHNFWYSNYVGRFFREMKISWDEISGMKFPWTNFPWTNLPRTRYPHTLLFNQRNFMLCILFNQTCGFVLTLLSDLQGVSQLMSCYAIWYNFKNTWYIATIICQYIRLWVQCTF